MISKEKLAKYKPTIGIECHVQLKTKTKLFAAVDNDARDAQPNTLISHICLGMPGALPVLNKKAIELATRAAFALGTKPQLFSKFDRKHYFYPDLPKGYQITQYEEPIIADGQVEITIDGITRKVGITRAHLEEDAGKNVHPAGKDYSLVDLNRAGTPLLEIVSEPDMHTAAEAKTYVKELYLLMKYVGVSDADLFHGNMRFDVNVSVSKDSGTLGTRSETKNLNSFRSVEKAVEYEIKRQIESLEKGEKIVQETRGWDEAKQKTLSQRGKEEAHDYRYMPEPDLPPVVLDDDYIEKVRQTMPALPTEWRVRLKKLGFDREMIGAMLEAQVELNTDFLALIEKSLTDKERAKILANWIINMEVPLRRELIAKTRDLVIDDTVREQIFYGVYSLLQADKLNSTSAKGMLTELLLSSKVPVEFEEYAKEHSYIQVSDSVKLAEKIAVVIANNPKAAFDVRNGETKAIGFLVGQVMKQTGGKANPQITRELIKKQLG